MANYIGPGGWNLEGAVLQSVQNSIWIQSEVQIANNASYNFPTIAITPKSSSSTLIYMSAPRFYSRAEDRSGNYGNTHIFIEEAGGSGVKMHEWINYADNASTTDGLRLSYPVNYHYSNSSTSTRTFNLRAYCNAPSPNKGRIAGEYVFVQMIIEIG